MVCSLKRWAEYLTIVATVSFIPVEIYKMLKASSLLKCTMFVIDVAIAVFLVVKVGASRKGREREVRSKKMTKQE